MVKINLSDKRMKIDRANAVMVGVIAGASFLVIFALIASNQLLSQRAYQSRVITEKAAAKKQLEENVKQAKNLAGSYKAFVGSTENIIGGFSEGEGDKDGDNARIVLNALPSKYDFPALAASMEKLFNDRNYDLKLEGNDDELNQQKQQGSSNPDPVDLPFVATVKGNYSAMQTLIKVVELSIRPISIQKLTLSGDDTTITMEISAKTYYLPEKTLDIKTKVVK